LIVLMDSPPNNHFFRYIPYARTAILKMIGMG
jgi:hypothetical protein